VVAAVPVLMMSGMAQATSNPTMTSSSYSVTESQVGAQGDFGEQSSNYSLKPFTDDGGATLGEDAVGNSSSTSYQTNGGFNTAEAPGLMFSVTNSNVALGTLSISSASTATAGFNVRDYTSSGYNVFMIGTPPTNAGHALTALTTDTAYSAGTEQFGVNMVQNSTVAGSVNATCQAAGYCFGVAGDGSTSNYTQTNKFRFNQNEVVASGAKSSGETDYVMSFMASISTVTPGGQYKGSITLIATGSY